MKRKAQNDSPTTMRRAKRIRSSLSQFSAKKKVLKNSSEVRENVSMNRRLAKHAILQIYRDTVTNKENAPNENCIPKKDILERSRGRPKKVLLTICPETNEEDSSIERHIGLNPTKSGKPLTKIKDKIADRHIPLKPLFILLNKSEVADTLKNLKAKKSSALSRRDISNPTQVDVLNYRGFGLKTLRIRIDRREVEAELKNAKAAKLNSSPKSFIPRRGRPPGSKNKPRTSLNASQDGNEISFGVSPSKAERSKIKTVSSKLKVKFSFQFKTKAKRSVVLSDANQAVDQIPSVSKVDTPEQSGSDLDENDNLNSKKVKKDALLIDEKEAADEGMSDAASSSEQRKKSSQDDSSDTDDSDDSDDSDNIVKRREKNLEDNKRMLQQMMAEFGGHDRIKPASMKHLIPKPKPNVNSPNTKRGSGAWLMKNSNRKSPPRLRSRSESQTTKRNVSFNQGDEDDDDDEKDGLKVYLDEEDREAEGVEFERISRRRSLHASNREILLVEDVTPAVLNKVLTKAIAKKMYDPINGTSCHQCRQKTKDTKTCCRSDECYGIRGQFCGMCLLNRYGEDPRKALLDPNWACPPCRGICNCSICRTRVGKGPTGCMTHHVSSLGYKSAHHLLAKKGSDGEEDNEEVMDTDADIKSEERDKETESDYKGEWSPVKKDAEKEKCNEKTTEQGADEEEEKGKQMEDKVKDHKPTEEVALCEEAEDWKIKKITKDKTLAMGKKLNEKKNTDNETEDKKKDAEDEQKVGNGEEGALAETDNDEKEAELGEDVLERVEDAAQGKKIDEASEGHLEMSSQEAEDIPVAAEKEMDEQSLSMEKGPMEAGNEEKEEMGQELVLEVEGKENESGTGEDKGQKKIKVVTEAKVEEEREIVEACHAVAEKDEGGKDKITVLAGAVVEEGEEHDKSV